MLAVVAATSGTALAGGLMLYEVGTADVGLASAGYRARAQDASTVFTNPSGVVKNLDFKDTWHVALARSSGTRNRA